MIDKWGHIGEDVIIGYDGENNAREIKFGVSKWLTAWPGTTPRIVIEREIPKEDRKDETIPKEDRKDETILEEDGKDETILDSYIAVSRMNGETIIWEVKGFDLEYPGYATMWIAFVSPDAEETRGLTPPTQVQILEGPNMIDGETPPEKTPPWMAQVIAAANRIDKTAEKIPQIIETALQEAKESGKFDGEDGKDGFTPTITLERVEDGVQVKATNKDGEQTETVYDGAQNVFVAKNGMLPAEIIAEAEKGRACFTLGLDGALYAYAGMEYVPGEGKEMLVFRRALKVDDNKLIESTVLVDENGRHYTRGPSERKIVNPEKLYIKKKDGKTYAYDGNSTLTVDLTAEGGGGEGSLVIRIYFDLETSEMMADHTPKEIWEAKQAGKAIRAYLKLVDDDFSVTELAVGNISEGGCNCYDFYAGGTDDTKMTEYRIAYDGLVDSKVYKLLNGADRAELEAMIKGIGSIGGSGLPAPEGPNLQLVTDKDGRWTQEERLAYSYADVGELFPETELPVQGGQFASQTPLDGKFVIGETYTVTINGTEYQTTAKAVELDGFVLPVLGNTAYAGGEDTGEMFSVASVPDELLEATSGVALVGAVDPYSEATVTIKITGTREIVKGIDEKYLGNLRGQKEIILTPTEEYDGYVASVPHEIAWAMDEAELQNAIRIVGEGGVHGTGMSVCAVAKVETGNMRAIQMLCMAFNDFYAHRWVVLHWYEATGNAVVVDSTNSLMPRNMGTEMAVPVIPDGNGTASALQLTAFKHLIGVAELNVRITENDDGSYSSSKTLSEISTAFYDGAQITATFSSSKTFGVPINLQPLYIGASAVFTGVSFTDDGLGGAFPQAVMVTIYGAGIHVDIVDVAERGRVEKLERDVSSISEEKADKEKPFVLIDSIEVGEGDEVKGYSCTRKLKDFELIVDVPEASEASPGGIEAYKGDKQFAAYIYVGQIIHTQNSLTVANSVILNGKSVVEYINTQYASTSESAKNQTRQLYRTATATDIDEPYTLIKLYSSKVFPTGTKITMRGVLADA